MTVAGTRTALGTRQLLSVSRLERYRGFYDACIALHTRSGVRGISMCLIPRYLTASTTAFATAGVDAIVPASPAPFAPIALTGLGVTVRPSSYDGTMLAFGTA